MNREGAEEGGNSLPVSKLKEVRAAENAAENATGLREVQSRLVRGVLVSVLKSSPMNRKKTGPRPD